jgi:hypothetical protein
MAKLKYGKYVLKHALETGDFGPGVSVVGERDFKSDFSIGFTVIVKTGLMEPLHVHPQFDMYVSFMGLDPKNIEDLGAEIWMYMGKEGEQEKYVITTPTTVYIPKGVWHCPLDFKRVDKPLLFVHSTIAPKYFKTPKP